jgi:hypothetical protein
MGGIRKMIREVTRDDIPVCVDIIRKSFKTVADEFGFRVRPNDDAGPGMDQWLIIDEA